MDPMDDKVLAEAVAWRVAIADSDGELESGFDAWLNADARHAEAWAAVSAPWDYFDANATAPELMAARRQALGHAGRSQARRFRRRVAQPRGVAAAAAVLVILVAGAVWRVTAPDVYQTSAGERRVITLSDKSRVGLDAGSRLDVRMSGDARRLTLVRGQARFDVAHDARRPFVVRARDESVVATGTVFNVDIVGERVLVTLIEGRVSVLKGEASPAWRPLPAPPARAIAHLTPGQQLARLADAPAAETVEVRNASAERTLAWESGQLIFEDEALASVAERVSRYGDTRITAAGNARDMKVSGVFNAGDVTTFVDTVQRVLPVRAQPAPDGGIQLVTTR